MKILTKATEVATLIHTYTNYQEGGSSYVLGIYTNDTTITFENGNGIGGDMLIFNVIMEYTKTTD